MYTSLVSTASVCPLDPDYLVGHTRLEQDADKPLLQVYAQVATELVENYLSRFLLTKTATWTISSGQNYQLPSLSLSPWQCSSFIQRPNITLPRPMSSVTSVTLGVWGQADQLLVPGTDYELDLTTQLGEIRWISSAASNSLYDHLIVVFTAGYGAVANIPVPILHAITLITTALYENRGDKSPEIYSSAVEALLAPYRMNYFG